MLVKVFILLWTVFSVLFTVYSRGQSEASNKVLTNHQAAFQNESQLEMGLMPQFTCNVCGIKFRYRSQMEIHVRVHTGVKPFVCKICKKGFAQKNNLKSHMSVHMKFVD